MLKPHSLSCEMAVSHINEGKMNPLTVLHSLSREKDHIKRVFHTPADLLQKLT